MIFVTVGTHEQPFDRLIKKVDELKRDGIIKDKVIIQTGYCIYEPKYCEWKKFFSYTEMKKNIEDARIVITHGGPSSFIMPLQIGKIPIVVPRKVKFHEHVNNHQVEFVKAVNERYKNLIVVENQNDLGNIILKYEDIIQNLSIETVNNNKLFVNKLEDAVNMLLEKNNIDS